MKLFKIFILAFFVVSLIACGGAEERKAVYMTKAKASIEAGDLDKARIDLKNALQIDPKYAEAYYLIGMVFEQGKDYRKAFANYKKAEELAPSLLENQAKLGMLYLILANDDEKAQEKIDLILSKDPGNVEGLLLKAAMMLKKNESAKSEEITKKIVANNPNHIDASVFLATLYYKENKNKDAIKVLEASLRKHPDNKKLNVLLALALMRDKQYDQAEVVYKKFIDLEPDIVANYNNLALFYHQTGKKDLAVSTLRRSIENNPEDDERYLSLVKYVKVAKGNDEALSELKRFVDENKNLGKLKVSYGELLYLNGDKQKAIQIYQEVINYFSNEVTAVDASVALALIYYKDKKFEKVSEIVDKAIDISPNEPRINLLRAQIALRNNNLDAAIIALRVIIKETPENVDAYLMLARIYYSEENEEQARSILNTAYENNITNPDALLKLAQFQISSNVDQAEKIIDTYNAIKVNSYVGLSLKAAVLNQKKEFDNAYKVASLLIDLYPRKSNGYLQSVPYLSQKGDKEKTISILEKGYISSKDNRKILVLLTSIQVSEKQLDVVVKRLQAELEKTPGDAQLKLLLARVYMVDNNFDRAVPLLNEAVEARPDVEDLYLLLSTIYQKKKDLSLAKSTLINGMSKVPSSIKISLKLATIYEVDSEYQKAINLYRDLYKLHPDNIVVINNLASLLSDYSDAGSDHGLMKSLAEKLESKGESIFLDTVGWVSYKLADYQSAVKHLTKVVEESPEVNVFNYHLGMAYKMSGNKAKAKVYLEKSLANGKKFREKELAKAALRDL